MQDSKFIGLDVHKATISVALAKGERGCETRHWGTIPHRTDHVRKLAGKLGPMAGDSVSAARPGLAGMACTASLLRWGTIASWSRRRSSR